MKASINTLLLLCLFTFVKGGVSYLKINDDSIEYGDYDAFNRKTKTQKFGKEDASKLVNKIHTDKELKVLYYIHSLYGNFIPYHRNSINQLKTIQGFDKIVCIEWYAKRINYAEIWEYAGVQGFCLGKLMNTLLSKNQNYMLCHSMGNRVFEGIANQLTAQAKIEKILLAAADLGIESFESGELFNNFRPKEIIVLVNEKDHLLRLSKFLNQNNRLGLNGNAVTIFPKISTTDCVKVWNVTTEVENGQPGSGHAYFKRTKTIFNKIKEELEH